MAVTEKAGVVLCALETYLCPHAVLGKGVAARVPFASEVQARGRGSTRRPETTIAARIGAGAGVQSKPRVQGERPMRFYAFSDAMRWSLQSALPVAAHNHLEAGPQTKALVGPHSLQTYGTSDPQ